MVTGDPVALPTETSYFEPHFSTLINFNQILYGDLEQCSDYKSELWMRNDPDQVSAMNSLGSL